MENLYVNANNTRNEGLRYEDISADIAEADHIVAYSTGYKDPEREKVREELRKNALKEFTLFNKFPGELRHKIWILAMDAEDPRLVYLLAGGRGIDKHNNYHCPAEVDIKRQVITIDGKLYRQAPSYFFVNQESRYYALQHYYIRFSVKMIGLRSNGWSVNIVQHVLMSHHDILVPCFAENQPWINADRFQLEFSGGSSQVRNMLLRLGDTYTNYQTYNLAAKLIVGLDNINTLERIYMVYQTAEGTIQNARNRQRQQGGKVLHVSVVMKLIQQRSLHERNIFPERRHKVKLYYLLVEAKKKPGVTAYGM
ncbi:hypothetical protein GGS21DRAFT_296270 [Xylaria nigripes]|nr:hypothetical protein GGS21DRAFT_296270 [Xylaria nigripes]